PQVARRRQLRPGAQGGALHRGDGDGGHLGQAGEHGPQGGEEPVALHPGEISAGAERPACAGDDERPDLPLPCVVDGAPQLEQRIEVDGVAALRPVDGEDDVPPAVLRPDHGSSTATTSPSCTLSSGATRNSTTVPSNG